MNEAWDLFLHLVLWAAVGTCIDLLEVCLIKSLELRFGLRGVRWDFQLYGNWLLRINVDALVWYLSEHMASCLKYRAEEYLQQRLLNEYFGLRLRNFLVEKMGVLPLGRLCGL